MLDVRYRPQPGEMSGAVLVVALQGWVDAGRAAETAVRVLWAGCDTQPVAVYDLAETGDPRQNRPMISVHGGSIERLDWPAVEIGIGHTGADRRAAGAPVLVCRGPEPEQYWRHFVDEIVGFAVSLGVRRMSCLGGMPAPVTHFRSPRVVATAAGGVALPPGIPGRGDYAGPTGVQTALQAAAGAAGMEAVGLWAQVPAYLAAVPSPPAAHALLLALSTQARLEIDLSAFVEADQEYKRSIDAVLAQRPDLGEIIDRWATVEQADDGGDRLAEEIMRFLRDEGGGIGDAS